jgi:hypothetical protein
MPVKPIVCGSTIVQLWANKELNEMRINPMIIRQGRLLI